MVNYQLLAAVDKEITNLYSIDVPCFQIPAFTNALFICKY